MMHFPKPRPKKQRGKRKSKLTMKEIRQTSNDRRLRKKEAAEKPACSLRTADRLGHAGKLTRVKIVGVIRFRSSQVQMLMNGRNHNFQS
jgi:hypothetical protein